IKPYIPGSTFLIGTMGADENELVNICIMKNVLPIAVLSDSNKIREHQKKGTFPQINEWNKILEIIKESAIN
ncbi:MAG: hypothetical protein ACPLVF_01895, partial [Thermovenabulum sp.]|uniref:hypothetical protein n=1 Tax=Thermovenabulum sp. TaxID=3100335 RepID=UPI003C7A725A